MRVLVTGGASGLGAALVKRYAARGDQVLAADIAELSGGSGAIAPEPPDPSTGSGRRNSVVRRRLDVTSEADWASAREWVATQWGGLDILVNNAGVAGGGRIELCSVEDWKW